MSVPDWNSAGVIPPIRPGLAGHHPDRSPYETSIDSFVSRFCTTNARADILDGLLNYRNELHSSSIVDGFQWLDGSFGEDIEAKERRDPNDVDVVTFFHVPVGMDLNNFVATRTDLTIKHESKKRYFVDAHFVTLGVPVDSWNVKLISYWNSLWGHRRDGLWKGFVQVDLAPASDRRARTMIADFRSGRSEG